MTRQPAPPAPLGPIPMGQNVLRIRICIELQPYLYGLLSQLNSNRVFHCTLPTACSQCPAGTEPTLGYEYKWWNVLPANMKASCFNVGNLKCDSMNGGCLFCISVELFHYWLNMLQSLQKMCRVKISYDDRTARDKYKFWGNFRQWLPLTVTCGSSATSVRLKLFLLRLLKASCI